MLLYSYIYFLGIWIWERGELPMICLDSTENDSIIKFWNIKIFPNWAFDDDLKWGKRPLAPYAFSSFPYASTLKSNPSCSSVTTATLTHLENTRKILLISWTLVRSDHPKARATSANPGNLVPFFGLNHTFTFLLCCSLGVWNSLGYHFSKIFFIHPPGHFF